MPADPTLAQYQQVAGASFTLHVGDSEPGLELQLHQVSEHAPSPGAPRPQPFTLTFVGPAGAHLPQATYRLTQASLGELDIFLVPLGPLADGRQRYEAVFN